MQVRCPQCHTPIELSQDISLSDIACPACGSSFSLIGEDETAPYAATKTIGHFELVEQVGTGTFGSVWRARDTDLDRVVAIKIPRKGQLDPSETEQFLREARAAAQLRHPNIVTVHEVGREADTVFIVSDYVQGLTLADWLTGQTLTSREAAGLCAKIADALHHAHEAGVIHRDLKPGNVILDSSGEPHIMDFGLARREAGEVTMTIEGKVLGTPAYMSPEQAEGAAHTADRRSDVYSLGVILFELLTGERPFRGNVRMLMHQVIHEDAPSPRRLNGNVPRDLETICLKCLEKDAEKRYPTAGELADELRRFLNKEPIQARPVTRAERAWRWCKRSPAVASLVATIAVLLVSGAAVSSYFAIAASSKAREADDAKVLAQKEAEHRRRLWYASDMIAASYAWEENDLERVEMLLKRHVPEPGQGDLRGLEWYCLWRAWHRTQDVVTVPQPDRVRCVAFSSPTDNLLAVGGRNGAIWICELGTFQTRACCQGHTHWVVSIAFSPDGKLLGSASRDGTIRLWRPDGSEESTIRSGNEYEYQAIAFSPTGDLLAYCGSDNTIQLCDVASLSTARALRGHKHHVTSFAFSPCGQLLISGSGDGTVNVWDVESGRITTSVKAHSEVVRSVAFSPDGELIASGSDDRTVKLWTTDGVGGRTTLIGHHDEVQSIAFSPDGELLATGSRDNTIRLWDVGTCVLRRTLRGQSFGVETIAFSPDGRTLASGAWDRSVRLWDIEPQDAQMELMSPSGYGKIAVSPKDRHLAVLSGKAGDMWEVRLWSLKTNRSQSTPIVVGCQPAADIAISIRQVLAVAVKGKILLFDLQTEGAPESVELHTVNDGGSVVFSPDGNVLAAGGSKGPLTLWDVNTQQRIATLGGGEQKVLGLAFAPDGKVLASGGSDADIHVWNTETGSKVCSLRGHSDSVSCLTFSLDGKILASGGTDRTIKLWKWSHPQRPHEELGRLPYQVSSLVFLDDGRTLLSAGGSSVVVFWDLPTLQQRFRMPHLRAVDQGVAFLPDDRMLVSRDRTGTIRLWRAATDEEVRAAGW